MQLQPKALEDLHSNHMGIEKIGILAQESLHRLYMKKVLKKLYKDPPHVLRFNRQSQKKTIVMPHKIPGKPLEIVVAHMLTLIIAISFAL